MLEKYRHETRPEIRFVDVDAFGHVNNAHYLTYFEQARVKYFDDIVGWKYDWSKQGIILARAEINYVKPVHFRDVVVIRTRCTKIGNKSLELAYVMIAQLDHLLCQIRDLYALAHVEDEYLSAFAHGSRFQDQLARFGNGHEIPCNVGMGNGNRSAVFYLPFKSRDHRLS